MSNPKIGSGFEKPKRFSEMTPREQINFAFCGDPDDDESVTLEECDYDGDH